MSNEDRCDHNKQGAAPAPFMGQEGHDDDQSEFIRAVVEFRTKYRRTPTLIEGYRIALSLGWRKS